jgi:hypothetical protein
MPRKVHLRCIPLCSYNIIHWAIWVYHVHHLGLLRSLAFVVRQSFATNLHEVLFLCYVSMSIEPAIYDERNQFKSANEVLENPTMTPRLLSVE